MCNLKCWGVALLGGVTPWGVAVLPFGWRVAIVVVAGAVSGGCLGGAWWQRSRGRPPARRPLLVAEFLGTTSAATAWVALLSFSAQLSKWPSLLLPAVAIGVALLVFVAAAWWVQPVEVARRWRGRRIVFFMVMTVSVSSATPGRRYLGGQEHLMIRKLAGELHTPRACVEWVHDTIRREKAPFTDLAVDTLRRRKARCGGMANLLDKLLKATGTRSRIIHLERGRRMHTLVEFWSPTNGWVVADAQERLTGQVFAEAIDGWSLLSATKASPLPTAWKDYSDLYVYVPYRGYRRVTERNYAEFYGDKYAGSAAGD